jgi:hypothetical protein
LKRRLYTFAAASVAAVAIAAPAHAAPFTPELDRAYNVAVGFWHASPVDCTTLDRQIVPVAAMPEGAEGWATIPAQPGPCVLYLSRTLAAPRWFERACAVLIHEVGHLLGFQHSADPANVMFPEVVAIPGTCWRAGLREVNRRDRRR